MSTPDRLSRAAALTGLMVLLAGAGRAAEQRGSHPRLPGPLGRAPQGGLFGAPNAGLRPAPQRLTGSPGMPKLPAVLCGAAGVPVQSPPLSAGVTVTGDTSGGTSALNGYTDSGSPLGGDWGGQELVYQFTTATTGDVRAYLEPAAGVDVDLFILSACDTDRVLAVGDYAAVALSQPAGTYYIVVDTYGYGGGPYTYYPGVFSLTVANSAGLLLVDDDGSGDASQCGTGCPDVGTRYTGALTAAAIPYTTYSVATTGPLPLATLVGYKSVIWFTGGSYEPGVTLTPADEDNLKLFLRLGGRLLLTGQDILYDTQAGADGRIADGSFFNTGLQVTEVVQDIDSLPANGCPANSGQTGALSISGTITDQSANAITGARVCFTGPAKGSVLSTAGGAYSLTGLPPGTYTYWLDLRTGTSPAQLSSTLVSGNSTGRNFVIQAQPWPPGRNLTGVAGNPVSSALPPFPSGNQLTNGVPVNDSTNSVTQNSDFRDYSIVIPTGSTSLTIATTNATGDVDLYVRFGAVPNTTTFDCAPGLASGNESCSFVSPSVGTYYIRVYGFATGVQPFTLTGSYAYTGVTQSLTLAASPPFNPFTDALTARYGQPVFFTADHRPAGFMFDGTNYANAPLPYSKSIFLAFAPELDATAGRLQTLLTRAVGWLNADYDYCPAYDATANPTGADLSEALFSEAGGTVNGYADPGETITYRLTLTNHDSVAHGYKIGLAGQQPFVTPSPTLRNLGSVAAGASAAADFSFTVGADIRVGETLGRAYNLVTDGVFCRSAGYGSFVGQAQILLVKDEGIAPNTTGIDVYKTAFKNLGRTWAVWDTAVFGHPPYGPTAGYLANEKMDAYASVFWFTGYDFAGTLTPAFSGDRDPEADLASLLAANSGRLFLSSQDYFWEKYGGLSVDLPVTDFGYTELGTLRINQDVVKDTLANVAAENGVWALEGALNTLSAQFFSNYADGSSLRTGLSYAKQLAHWDATGLATGAARFCRPGTDCTASATPNTLKLVFMPYAFENLADGGGASNKQRIIEKALCQFAVTTTSGTPAGTPPCGYSPPAPFAGYEPTIMPQQLAPGSWQFTWSVEPLACNGDRIGGNWKVNGALGTPGSLAYLRDAAADVPAATPANDAVSAGQTRFYAVASFADSFGQPPATSCP